MTEWYLFKGKATQQEGYNEKEGYDEEIQKKLREKIKEIESPPWRKFGNLEDLTINNPDAGKKVEEGTKTEKQKSIEELAEELDNERFKKLIDLARNKEREKKKGRTFILSDSEEAEEVRDAVNAAIYLRRPLLLTGKPGSGKTSLAYALAYELNLASVLSWSINARSTLQEGLYRYDAIARLQDSSNTNNGSSDEQPIGKYIKLGALGTAFLPSFLPRVLLIDEIDKCDINLPNDLLNIFEEGQFEIPELVRRSGKNTKGKKDNLFQVQTQDEDIEVLIRGGRVRCYAFPIIIMTSNGERDFPQAFKRRCLRVRMPDPNANELEEIVKSHFSKDLFEEYKEDINELITSFVPKEGEAKDKATDQLLNAIYVIVRGPGDKHKKEAIRKLLMKPLTEFD